MAYLFAKEPGAKLHELVVSLITENKDFSEMGLAYSWDGKVIRQTGFESLEALINAIPEESGALVYLDNPKEGYPESEFSPLLIGQDKAFAFGGEMLALSSNSKNRSNNAVFGRQTMQKVYGSSPELLELPAFHWLIAKVARSFVGGAVLNGDGSFTFYNGHLFEVSDGFKFMDSDKVESESLKANWKRHEIADVLQ